MRTLLPEGWPRPKGYSNGIEAEGRIVFVAGQIGWTPQGQFEATTLPAQFAQTLDNTLAVLRCANAGPEHIVRMTWYVTDKREYLAAAAEAQSIDAGDAARSELPFLLFGILDAEDRIQPANHVFVVSVATL